MWFIYVSCRIHQRMDLLIFIGILFLVIVILSLGWRFASQRRSLPCPVWMKWMLDPPFSWMSGRTKKTLKHLNLSSGMQVLDAGCGPGRLSIPMAKLIGPFGTVTAMDIQEGMLEEVKKRADKDGDGNILYLQGGIGEGKLEPERYDRIVMITVLGEIPDRKRAMKEIYGALKSGGLLLIEETIRDPHFQRVKAVRELANETGFVEKVWDGSRFNYTILFEKP